MHKTQINQLNNDSMFAKFNCLSGRCIFVVFTLIGDLFIDQLKWRIAKFSNLNGVFVVKMIRHNANM